MEAIITLSIVCFILLILYIRERYNSRLLIKTCKTYQQIVIDNEETKQNYRGITASLKSILKTHNIDLGNVLPKHTALLETFAHKLTDIRNSDVRIPIEAYNKILDIEKEMLTMVVTLEREKDKL